MSSTTNTETNREEKREETPNKEKESKTVNIHEIDSYYLTVNDARAKILESRLLPLFPRLQRVDGIRYQDRYAGCAIGHLKILRHALSSPGEFRPFLVLEDDVSTDIGAEDGEDSDAWKLTIPVETDCVYVGVSTCAVNFSTMYWDHTADGRCAPVQVQSVEGFCGLWRIVNMLSTHAILYCTRKCVVDHVMAITQYLALKSINQQYFPSGHDAFIAQLQLTSNTLAVKRPLFYQSQDVGGFERETRIVLDGAYVKEMERGKDEKAEFQQEKRFELLGALI